MDSSTQYEILVDLYKHFNEVVLKGIAFLYAVISGLFAFYLSNQNVEGVDAIRFVAIFAMLVSAVFSVFLLFLFRNLGLGLRQLASKLELDFYPSVLPICCFLVVNFFAMTFACYRACSL